MKKTIKHHTRIRESKHITEIRELIYLMVSHVSVFKEFKIAVPWSNK